MAETKTVELHGGYFDGLVGEVPSAAVEAGMVLVETCRVHGVNSYCECDDAYWHGYFAEQGKGSGQFVVRDA